MSIEAAHVRPEAPPIAPLTPVPSTIVVGDPVAVLPARIDLAQRAAAEPPWTQRLREHPVGAGLMSWLGGVGFLASYLAPPAMMIGAAVAMGNLDPYYSASRGIAPVLAGIAGVLSMFYQGVDDCAYDTAVKEGRAAPRLTSFMDTVAFMVLPPAVVGLGATAAWGLDWGLSAAAGTWIASTSLGLSIMRSRADYAEKKRVAQQRGAEITEGPEPTPPAE